MSTDGLVYRFVIVTNSHGKVYTPIDDLPTFDRKPAGKHDCHAPAQAI
jgi:hypothetical protein